MKKLASLLVLATLAFAGTSPAQSSSGTAKSAQDEGPFGGPLGTMRPKPKASATPAAESGGKKMIGEAMITADDKGTKAVDSFPAGTTTIYLVTKNVSGSKKGDKVTAEWFADDAGKALPKGKRFYNSAIALPDTASYNPSFHVTGPIKGAFPPGKYHVDLSIGGEKFKSAKFAVQ